jgi:hypothetical protein
MTTSLEDDAKKQAAMAAIQRNQQQLLTTGRTCYGRSGWASETELGLVRADDRKGWAGAGRIGLPTTKAAASLETTGSDAKFGSALKMEIKRAKFKYVHWKAPQFEMSVVRDSS